MTNPDFVDAAKSRVNNLIEELLADLAAERDELRAKCAELEEELRERAPFRRSPHKDKMTLSEVSVAIGVSTRTIKKRREDSSSHPFYRKAFKSGRARNSPLFWWTADVDEYLRELAGRGIGGAA
ncbi:hypothetical protein OED52_13865 [Rhodococcus sp. Z13]|uniref:Uncharacterized protein n=1 Tax=Rhodococcus sacchari TaxID=2962047 RepID=A0ACD4DDK3_9NOCA|nr:hypothetical protein [Rhodococcus sp. Z13]UYP17758.1 hypothetical protein OED52_13865 [Rhodococcus sp. Z13]